GRIWYWDDKRAGVPLVQALEKSQIARNLACRLARGDSEFAIDALQLRLDRVWGNYQLFSDRADTVVLNECVEHYVLALGERGAEFRLRGDGKVGKIKEALECGGCPLRTEGPQRCAIPRRDHRQVQAWTIVFPRKGGVV